MQNIELISTHTQLKWIIFDSDFDIFFFPYLHKIEQTHGDIRWHAPLHNFLAFFLRVSFLLKFPTNKLLAILGTNE